MRQLGGWRDVEALFLCYHDVVVMIYFARLSIFHIFIYVCEGACACLCVCVCVSECIFHCGTIISVYLLKRILNRWY